MLKNENKRDNLFILTNVIIVSKQYSRDFLAVSRISWMMLILAVQLLSLITWKVF